MIDHPLKKQFQSQTQTFPQNKFSFFFCRRLKKSLKSNQITSKTFILQLIIIIMYIFTKHCNKFPKENKITKKK